MYCCVMCPRNVNGRRNVCAVTVTVTVTPTLTLTLTPTKQRNDEAAPAMSEKELRAAMASLEDADDVEAGRALEREAADEQLEFDDNGASNKVGSGGPVVC